MTTQAELLKLAEKHRESDAAVAAILTSLTETKHWAEQNLAATRASCDGYGNAIAQVDGFSVVHDASNLVQNAAKAAASLSAMASLYVTLACVLQALGEDIRY